MVIYRKYIKDEGVGLLVLVRKKEKEIFKVVLFFLKMDYSTAEFEKQFTSCYSKYIQSESYNH